MLEMGGVGDMDLADTRDFRRGCSHAVDTFAGDEQMYFPELRSCGHGRQGGVLDGGTVLSHQTQPLHAPTPKVFNLAISSSTEPTLSPAWRLAGSVTLSTSSRGAV